MPVTPGEARGYLARFLFRGDDVFKEVRLLSGGERSRLELALLGVMPSNVYLLDEPTNHLDVVAREAIESFLIETPATMLVVSHDRRFLDTVCERLWVVDDGAVAPFDGGYRAWRAAVVGRLDGRRRRSSRRRSGCARRRPRSARAVPRRRSVRRGGRAPRPLRSAAAGRDGAARRRGGRGRDRRRRWRGDRRERHRCRPRPRSPKLSKDAYRRQRETIDAELTRLGLRKNHLELELSKPAVQSNFIELRRVSSELADVETALAAAEDAWLALEERAP